MLYSLLEFIRDYFDFPGSNLFFFLSFRSVLAFTTSLLFVIIFGKKFILFFEKRKILDQVRELGLKDENNKKNTPSMGGLIIIFSILTSVLLFSRIKNVYIIALIITTLILGFIGALDDYIKVFKKDKKGIQGKVKILGQVIVGIIIAFLFNFNENVVIREYVSQPNANELTEKKLENIKSLKTTIPFLKDNSLDYKELLKYFNIENPIYVFIFYALICIFIIVSVSNSVNLTDGLDGLAAGNVAIVSSVLGIFAYLSGNAIFSQYLFLFHIPNLGEISVFISALVGACIGFLWYNSYPAQVFMGDVGSLTLGGIIAVTAISVRKELLLPLLCGVFLIESLSVIIQVTYFKITKFRYGVGRRVFKMSPIHHHFQKKGWHESKIVVRFWLICIILAGLTLMTVKIR